MPRVCLQFVIVVFPDHTHLLFLLFAGVCKCKPLFVYAISLYFGVFIIFTLCFDCHCYFMFLTGLLEVCIAFFLGYAIVILYLSMPLKSFEWMCQYNSLFG